MKTLTAVLFAGGESRRMGRDKATLEINGEPLWSRQLRMLHELSPEKIWISARAKPVWCPLGIEVVLDESPSRGPLGGLAAAMGKIETTHLLVLAVDMPLMNAKCLAGLFARARTACGVVIDGGDYYEPLAAIYPREARATVSKFADGDNNAMQPLIAHLVEKQLMMTIHVSRREKEFFQNINTLCDFDSQISENHR